MIARLPDVPGSLGTLLSRFEEFGINLSKVESHPAKHSAYFKYYFFIEFDGHIDDPQVKEAIAPYDDNVTLLGSYVKVC
jgi:chorismate mutase/prephenate dehydratase